MSEEYIHGSGAFAREGSKKLDAENSKIKKTRPDFLEMLLQGKQTEKPILHPSPETLGGLRTEFAIF